MAFVNRLINLTFVLGTGAFGADGSDTVKITGLRTSLSISKPGGNGYGTAEIRIFGMLLSTINQLSTYGIIYPLQPRNSVIIEAGDSVNGMTTIFSGQILGAWFDGSEAGNPAFVVTANAGTLLALIPAAPTSYKTSVRAADVISYLASLSNLRFVNYGVDTPLPPSYFSGSLAAQLKLAITAAKCDSNGLDGSGVLAIYPRGGARNDAPVKISAETGMVGFPTWTAQGIVIKALLNGALNFGSQIEVTSEIINAVSAPSSPGNIQQAGKPQIWNVANIDYELESLVPGGAWFMTVEAWRPGLQYTPSGQ